MRILTIILITLSTATLFADPPDWIDDPGAYQFTATIAGGIVLNINGEQMGDDGDMFAAFDDAGNVRGVAIQLGIVPPCIDINGNVIQLGGEGDCVGVPFGPHVGTVLYEMQLRSNSEGDLLAFKYYDVSEDAIIDVVKPMNLILMIF